MCRAVCQGKTSAARALNMCIAFFVDLVMVFVIIFASAHCRIFAQEDQASSRSLASFWASPVRVLRTSSGVFLAFAMSWKIFPSHPLGSSPSISLRSAFDSWSYRACFSLYVVPSIPSARCECERLIVFVRLINLQLIIQLDAR